MKRFIFALLCVAILIPGTLASGSRRSAYLRGVAADDAGCGAWLGTWSNRVQIDISNTNVDTTLTDFPVKLYLSTSSGSGAADVSFIFDELASDGNRKKIALSENHSDEYYAEIERWTDDSEIAVLHVEVPSVSSSAATTIFLYFDSSESDNSTYVGDTTDAVVHNVWDSDFEAVFHMNQDPNGDPANGMKGSTSNGHTMTPAGSMTTADLVTGEKGEYGIDFDGNDDAMETDASRGVMDQANWTIETQFKIDAGASVGAYWYAEFNGSRVVTGQVLWVAAGNLFRVGINHGHFHNKDLAATIDDWYYHAARGDSGNTLRTWLDDGTLNAGENVGSLMSPASSSECVGCVDVATAEMHGVMSEHRVSSTDRTDAWLKATSYTLKDGLVSYGTEETCP